MLAGAAGTANAVYVVFGGVRQLVVDYHWQVVDVQTAGSDIGADQDADLAGLEAFECFGALLLTFVAVDGIGFDTLALKIDRQTAGTELGTDKHQHLFEILMREKMYQQAALEVGGHRIDAMGNRLADGVAARHFDQLGCLQHAIGEVLDLV